jgi:tripartite-type tricarboxylate transporter receptor subunit TctC
MGQWLADRLGQPFVIENRPGGAGNTAVAWHVRAIYPSSLVEPITGFTSDSDDAKAWLRSRGYCDD